VITLASCHLSRPRSCLEQSPSSHASETFPGSRVETWTFLQHYRMHDYRDMPFQVCNLTPSPSFIPFHCSSEQQQHLELQKMVVILISSPSYESLGWLF
jgi:hypothetical protein